jgi:hypothetical protein
MWEFYDILEEKKGKNKKIWRIKIEIEISMSLYVSKRGIKLKLSRLSFEFNIENCLSVRFKYKII